jgi:hypothetical protein
MAEILTIAVNVSTPLALLGLIAALVYFAYTRRLKYDENKLKRLSPEEAAKRTDEYLTRYNIDGKWLPLSEQLALIKDEMAKRHQKSLVYLVVAAVVFSLCFGMAVIAYAWTHNPQPDKPTPSTDKQVSDQNNALIEAITASLNASTEKEKQLTSLLKEKEEKDHEVQELKSQLTSLQKKLDDQIRAAEAASKTQAFTPEQVDQITEAKRESKRLLEEFLGTSRKASKTSISKSPVEDFSTLRELVAALPSDEQMRQKQIPRDATSSRVPEEDRNVKVNAYIYAARKEADNDYHLILGTSPEANDRVFLTAEVSGLPSAGPFREPLKKARTDFESFFNREHPSFLEHSTNRYVRFNPPIHVKVAGSLFYDNDHPPGALGLDVLRPKTSWEIHPVTDIKFP